MALHWSLQASFTKWKISPAMIEITCEYKLRWLEISTLLLRTKLEDFMNTFDLVCLIEKLICCQSTNPSYIDLILTNKKVLFKNSDALGVRISDHYT